MKKLIIAIFGLLMVNNIFAANFAAPPAIMPRTESTDAKKAALTIVEDQNINVNIESSEKIVETEVFDPSFDGTNALEIINEDGTKLISIDSIEQVTEPVDFSSGVPTVENIQFKITSNNSVKIEFDEILGVDTYYILYGTQPVVESDDVYNMPAIDTLGENSFEIENLEANVSYYLSVVANWEENYSDFFSEEIEFKIDPSLLTNPKFLDVSAINSKIVNVQFDQDIEAGSFVTENFTLVDTFNSKEVEILEITQISSNQINLIVSKIDSGFEYKLQVDNILSIDQLEMLDSNKEFTFRASELEQITDLKLLSVEVLDVNGIEITFNDELTQKLIKENVSVVLKSDPNVILEVKDVLQKPTDSKQYLVIVDDLKSDTFQFVFKNIEGINQGQMSPENSTFEFLGVDPVIDVITPLPEEEITSNLPPSLVELPESPVKPDQVSPSDVRNLDAKFIDEALSKLEVSFEKADDIDQDLAKYELYLAKDSDNYFYFGEIQKDQELPILIEDLEQAEEFFNIKVTSKDTSDNESLGAIYKLVLPETGPAGALAMFGLSVLGSRRLTRRRD